MNIPFTNLGRQQTVIAKSIRKNINRVLAHNQYIFGPETEAFEERLAAVTQVKHVVTCSSGTDALLMGLMAHDVGPGDAVFTSAFSFTAAAEVVMRLGATVVFVDIDPVSFTIDPQKLTASIERVAQDGKLT
ncbi:MAG: aminotransferase class I/II-fold pyridoxal phosphate-dependent enzyme, partial [Acidobacteriota bacterium]